MSKKSKKKKESRKISAKKEKYLKFRRDKGQMKEIQIPDLTPEQIKMRQEDEIRIGRTLSYLRNPPPKEIVERKARSKR